MHMHSSHEAQVTCRLLIRWYTTSCRCVALVTECIRMLVHELVHASCCLQFVNAHTPTRYLAHLERSVHALKPRTAF
jgi:hypothetical protein